MQTDVIRRISIQATQQGVAEATAGLKNLSAAQDGVVSSSEKSTKSQLSVAAAYERQQRSLDVNYRSTQQFEKAQRTLDQALQQGIVTAARHGELSALNTARFGMQSDASKALGTITSDLNSRVQASAGAFGVAGQALSALGPIGIAVAAVLGVVYLAINQMISEANRMGDKAVELRSFSQTTGLAISDLKALGRAGSEVGVGTDTIAASIEKFTISLEDARKATGPLYDAVRQISGGLATELSLTKTSAQAWDVLAKARAAASDQAKNALSKAAFGKGGIDTGLVLDVTAEAGGLDVLVAKQQKLNGQTDDQIKKWAATKIQIDETEKRTANLMAATYTQEVLDRLLQAAQLEERVTRAIIAGTAERQKSVSGQYDAVGNFTGGPQATPIAPIDQARSNLGQALSAGQRPDLSGYQEQVKAIGMVDEAEKREAATAKAAGAEKKYAQEAAIRDANLTKEQVGYLGSAATANERLSVKLKELTAARLTNAISEEVYNRAVSAANLDAVIAKQSAHNAVLGAAAPLADVLALKSEELAKARQQDSRLTQTQIDRQLQITAAQNSGLTGINAQIDAEKVRGATLFMSTEATLAYTIAQTEINRQLAAGRPLQDINVEGIKAGAAELAKTTVQVDKYADALNTAKDALTEIGKAAFSSALQGKLGMDQLVSSLDSVAKKLADKAFDNLTSLDPDKMIVGAVQAGASALISAFTGDQKAKKELEDAKAAWAKMADQVLAFNRAAAGFTLGPLTQQLQALSASVDTLMAAAVKAKDAAGAAKLGDTFNKGAARLVDEFKAGAVTLSPLQTAIKGVNDEYKGLYETLTSLHLDSLTIGLAESAQAQIRNLIAQYTDQLNASLADRLNVASGKAYLNSAAALQKQHAVDLAAAGELGNDPAVLAQISAVFHAEAQKIVEDAGLVGAGFSDFINLFPDFSGVVTQSATAIKAANDNFLAMTKTINDYLDSLKIGDKSILSPQDQLGAAQDQFNRQLGLAGSGDQTALGSITQYASALLDQAKSFYASSGGYTDIYRTVTAQLSGLTGGGPATGFATPSVSAPMAMSGISSSIVPRISVTAAAGNDNGQLFTQQTNSLVQAIGSAAGAQIAKLQEQVDRLVAQNALLIAAVTANKPAARRPNDRAA